MNHFFKKGMCLFLSLFVSFCLQAQPPAPAKQIPEFQFYQFNGKPFGRSQLAKDKLLFIVFFDVTCDHCQHAFQQINANYAAFKNVGMYLVSLDSEAAMANFLTRFAPNLIGKPNVTLLRDVNNEFIQRFTPRKYPSMFLYNARQQLLLYYDEPEKFPNFLRVIPPVQKSK